MAASGMASNEVVYSEGSSQISRAADLSMLRQTGNADDGSDAILDRDLFYRVVLESGKTVVANQVGRGGDMLSIAPAGTSAGVISAALLSRYLFSVEKRVFDLLGASILVLLSLPVFVLVAILVKATSRGPILFRQQRNGAAGKSFTVLKFRSMTWDSCLERTVRQATRIDTRITFVGRFIRRTSIDELPQLFNVLKGEMSLIGPRPHAIEHDRLYGPQIALYSWRFAARPGLSGLAQISGARGETRLVADMERRVALDIEYIKKASLFCDLRIVFATCREMILSSSAY